MIELFINIYLFIRIGVGGHLPGGDGSLLQHLQLVLTLLLEILDRERS